MLNRVRSFLTRALRHLAWRIEPPSIWAFLDARQGELAGLEPLDLHALIAAYAAGRGECFLIQIGAHTGDLNDPVVKAIRAYGLRGILVEPQAAAFEALRKTYADQPQVILERAAIAAHDGDAPLYKVRPEFWAKHGFPDESLSQVSSLSRAQIGAAVEFFGGSKLRAAESAYLDSELVPALTLATLLERHRVDRIDLLQIDAEGFDYEILKMIDWSRIAPALIHYETLNLAVDDRLAAWALLRANGYELWASDSINTLAIRRDNKSAAVPR